MCVHTHTPYSLIYTHIFTHTHTHVRYVYLPSNGAIFVGNMIVFAFISSPLDLIRAPEFIIYLYRRLKAQTTLEIEKALSKVKLSLANFFYLNNGSFDTENNQPT